MVVRELAALRDNLGDIMNNRKSLMTLMTVTLMTGKRP